MPIKGIKAIKTKLTSSIDRELRTALVEHINNVAAKAVVYTPEKTLALLHSQRKSVNGTTGNSTGVITYGDGITYAQFVHDPDVIQRFRKSTAIKEFLFVAADENQNALESSIEKIVGGFF